MPCKKMSRLWEKCIAWIRGAGKDAHAHAFHELLSLLWIYSRWLDPVGTCSSPLEIRACLSCPCPPSLMIGALMEIPSAAHRETRQVATYAAVFRGISCDWGNGVCVCVCVVWYYIGWYYIYDTLHQKRWSFPSSCCHISQSSFVGRGLRTLNCVPILLSQGYINDSWLRAFELIKKKITFASSFFKNRNLVSLIAGDLMPPLRCHEFSLCTPSLPTYV